MTTLVPADTNVGAAESINGEIRCHSVAVEEWKLRKTAEFCYAWFDRFNSRFFGSLPRMR